MRTFLILTAIATLALGSALADECVPSTTPAVAVGPYYIYDCLLDDSPQGGQECWFPGPWAVWVYEESNGIAGLQRDDEIRDDTCAGQIPGDTIVF
jgi:hypothetical protein